MHGIGDDGLNHFHWQDGHFHNQLNFTLPLMAATPNDYSAALFVGGHGATWDYPENGNVKTFIRKMYEINKPVAAVFHGLAAFVNVKLSNGQYLLAQKRIAAFVDTEEMEVGMGSVVPFMLETGLKARGALVQTAEHWQ